jgi:hypothetical protein
MATNSSSADDFDFAAFIQSPMQLITGTLAMADTARRSIVALVATIESLQRSAQQFESILERIDGVVTLVEGPARALAPEMDRFGRHLQEIGDVMDGPVAVMLSNMSRMGEAFERANFEQFPEVLEVLTGQLRGLVTILGEMPRRMGPLGELLGGGASMFSALLTPQRRSESSTVAKKTAGPKATGNKKTSAASSVSTSKSASSKAAAKRAAIKRPKR